MALKGTLKDFGIADILQLIGQQQKTGTLFLKNKEQEVQIGFKDGNIVKAESSTRKRKDLIGNMLVRAEVITEAQLNAALETQKRTQKRLGDVLVSTKAITAENFKRMVQLQATETLYRLFGWKTGTYEFEQGEVDYDQSVMTPLRAESVLMEGFRMVDEWPVIRKAITSYEMTFEQLKDLPPPVAKPEGDAFDAALDDAFAEKKKDESKGDFASVSDNERKVYDLVKTGRDVRRLIDLSSLGEFETCKSLLNLVNLGYLKANKASGKSEALGPTDSMLNKVGGIALRVMVTVMVLAVLALVFSKADFEGMSLTSGPTATYADPATQRFVSKAQLARIEAALDVYKLEKGEVPEKLEALVDTGLLKGEDLRYPWRDAYYYRRTEKTQFVLLPPLR
ncbi:MAG: DUF4388 domain-containing protein [Myxococcaceae bacterium]